MVDISSNPIFATKDVAKSIAYYKEILGFKTSWGDEPGSYFGAAQWGDITIMFNQLSDLADRVEGHEHWFRVEELDELYALHQSLGANIISPLKEQPWGMREYVVKDLNGYHLRFAGSPGEPEPSLLSLPPGVTFVRRVPTPEEMKAVACVVFGYQDLDISLLEKAWSGVVAFDEKLNPIGCLRIMFDAKGWYSVWDVAVLEEWQGKRVGEAMMKEALAAVEQVSPGAFVFLFTFKSGFYERLGFTLMSAHSKKV